jgi:hypothetical protein
MKGEMRNGYRVLDGNFEGKIPLGITRRRRQCNIRMDRKYCGKVLSGFIWLMIGTSGGPL